MTSSMEVEALDRLERGPMLRPIIGRLLNALGQQARHEGSVKIGIMQYSVEVTPWERGAVLELRDRGLRDTAHWSFRLLEALAVQAKGYADLHRLENDPLSEEQKGRWRQELVGDYALGRALETELIEAIKALEASDRKGPAKNLSGTRQRLGETLRQLASALSEPDLDQAKVLTENLIAPLDDQLTLAEAHAPATASTTPSPSRPTPPTPPPSPPPTSRSTSLTSRSGRPAPGWMPKDRSRLHLALIGLGTFLLVSLVTFAVLLAGQRYDVNQAFAYTPGVRGMTGTPPRATVTVSAETWRDLDPPGRTRLVSAIGAAVRREGYTSAVVVTPDKKPVAEWVNKRGSKVY